MLAVWKIQNFFRFIESLTALLQLEAPFVITEMIIAFLIAKKSNKVHEKFSRKLFLAHFSRVAFLSITQKHFFRKFQSMTLSHEIKKGLICTLANYQ